MISTSDIVVVGLVIVVLFGAPQIPKVARSLGEGLKEFKKALKEGNEENEENEKGKESLLKKRITNTQKESNKKPGAKKIILHDSDI
jgi:sec-independent protein translocase protein TatA